MAVDHNNPQSRDEEILIATIDGTEYNKLPQSRIEELLLELKEVIEEGGSGGGGIRPIGVTTTPLYDGATTNPIQINGESYTAETGDMVTYQSTEFLFNVNEVWQELGDVSIVLAIIDNIFADIAPAFDATGIYAVDDYVIYNDQLYRCTTAHTGAWDENDFTATTISDEITDVSDAVNEIKDGTVIDSFADVETALADKVNKVNGKGLSTNDYDDTEKAAVAAATSAISTMKDGTDIDSFGDVEVALLDKADVSDLGTAAAKDSTNSVTAGSTDLVESGAVKDAIDAAVSSAYHHAGTKTVAQLTHDLLIAANEGNVYNITDSGTTTSDFIEGIGKTIDEGSNVGICKVGNVYMFDLLSGFVDTSNFVQKSVTAGLLKNDGTVDTTIQGDVSTLKSGLTTLDNEVNGDAVTYPYADVITINDAVPANLADCNVKIEPVQDLHGYDKPWVGGAYKNKAKPKNYSSDSYDGTTFSSPIEGAKVIDDVVLPAGTYVASIKMLSVPSTQRTLTFYKTGDVELAYFVNLNEKTVGQVYTTTFTLSEESTVYAKSWATGGGEWKMQMQLEAGETATTFAPYTNICPISGHTEAVVTRAKNVWTGNDTYTTTASDFIIPNTNCALPAGSYKMVFDMDNPAGQFELRMFKNNSTQWADRIFINAFPATSHKTVDITISESATNLTLYNNNSTGVSIRNVRLYSNVSEYTLALGDTIYGGEVDFDSGVMTVTHGYCKVPSNVEWTYRDTYGGFFFSEGSTYAPGLKANSVNISNMLETVTDISTFEGKANAIYTVNELNFKVSGINTVSDFETWLDNNDLYICYELATPTTIQLTPQQIQLLKGTNTLYASTGDISVTVNGVSGAIGDLQEQIDEIPRLVDYSTTEQKTGQKWIDGKDIYQKTIDCGTISGSSDIEIAHNITNLDNVLSISGILKESSNSFLPLPYVSTVSINHNIRVSLNATNVIITKGRDVADGGTAFVTVLYTKSTT